MNWIQNATYFKFSPHVKKISVRETSSKSLLFNFASNFHLFQIHIDCYIQRSEPLYSLLVSKNPKEFPIRVKFSIMQDDTKVFTTTVHTKHSILLSIN